MKTKMKGANIAMWSLLFMNLLSNSITAHADVVMDWNIVARDIVVDSKLNTPLANRAVAIVHTAVYEAVNSITQEYPGSGSDLEAVKNASVEAAVATASTVSMRALIPEQGEMIERSYAAALKFIADGEAKEAGIAVGTRAAEAVLAKRMNDGSKEVDTYRPHTSAGNYVPTTIPAVPHWTNRKPWLMKTSSQFRPDAPPALNSKQWARDFMEVKNIGRLDSAQRSQQQTEIAKFWEATLPPIYHGVVHSVAAQTGRSVTENARLFALITQGADDALIAVFDAKYHHGFWRPITAIRNADIDGNDDTERDATWQPFIPTPMHPEYPCAHCVVAGTVGAILKAEMGSLPMPVLSTSSVTANGVTRSWPSVDEFVQEVSDARIYDGVHYRTSAEVGTAMGISIGENTVDKF